MEKTKNIPSNFRQTLYKLSKSFIPCILLTLSLGFCYAFSLFAPDTAKALGCSLKDLSFAFCLNIFFLGTGAALFGPLVEKRIKAAAFTSTSLLAAGLLLSSLACAIHSPMLFYFSFGCLCGIAEGCGYVTPNKNMALWFPSSKLKGILVCISIFTFGLGSAFCSWLYSHFAHTQYGISGFFIVLAAAYAFFMCTASVLIRKPRYAEKAIEKAKEKPAEFSYISRLKSPFFICSWLFMFINISMGLILIGSCASFLASLSLSPEAVVIVMMLCGISNGGGRIIFPIISDVVPYFSNPSRPLRIWTAIALIEAAAVTISYFFPQAAVPTFILINATYGAAFATLPKVLMAHYGKTTLSQTHGFCLTSWAMASLAAYAISLFLLPLISNCFAAFFIALGIGYIMNIAISLLAARQHSKVNNKN